MKARYADLKLSIANIIKCFICQNQIQDAVMCPNCQKLSCQYCSHKWLIQNKTCFNCHFPLKFSQEIRIGFMNDLAAYLNEMQSTRQSDKAETCKEHHIQLLYYCNACNESLCSDCFMLDNKHKEHRITKLSALYEEKCQSVKRQTQDIDVKYDKLAARLQLIKEKMGELSSYSKNKAKRLQESYDAMKAALDKKVKGVMKMLVQAQSDISNQMASVNKIKTKVSKEVNGLSECEFITKSSDLQKTMQEIDILLNKTQNDNDIAIDLSFELPDTISPSYESRYFCLDNYKHYMSKSEVVYFPDIKINGQRWRMKMYPNGNEDNRLEYLAVFIELKEANLLSHKGKYLYKFELVDWLKGKNYSQEYSSVFCEGDCFGSSKYFPIRKLKSEGFISTDDKLGIKVSIKPESMDLLRKDMNNYISKLEKVIRENEMGISLSHILNDRQRRRKSCPHWQRSSYYQLMNDDEESHQKQPLCLKKTTLCLKESTPKETIEVEENELYKKKLNSVRYAQSNHKDEKQREKISKRKERMHQRANGTLNQEHHFQLDFNQILQELSSKREQKTIDSTARKKADNPRAPLAKPDTYEISLSLSCAEALPEVSNVKQFPVDANYIIPKAKDNLNYSSEESSISSIMESINKKKEDYSSKRRDSTDYSQNNKKYEHNQLSGSYDSFLSKVHPENKFHMPTHRNKSIAMTTLNNHNNRSKDIKLSDLLSKRR